MDVVELKKVNNYCWTLRAAAGVSSPIQLYGSESLIREMDDKVLEQISNAGAQLPRLVNAAMTMPDARIGFRYFPVASIVYVPIWLGMSLKGFVRQCG
ncbi:hypothetical protein [Coxiella endosymbiont of Ornithodoros amblus]|uniref:hypothetical protein n=1 Tax=Coxiella endosymbiont of Ornithodoros amblus TaxID=1656166 RepID=UPI00244E16E0|nr:hypothetical protein [Coxiella endosymbiont of Ornithodoros amblus]